MRIKIALASLLLVLTSLAPVPMLADARPHAQLRLLIVDQNNAALPHATVTIYTLDGNPGVTVTADENGVATFSPVAVGLTEIVAKSKGFSPYIDKATLTAGDNMQTLTLRASRTGRES
jgi:hypothetical protein